MRIFKCRLLNLTTNDVQSLGSGQYVSTNQGSDPALPSVKRAHYIWLLPTVVEFIYKPVLLKKRN